MLFFFILQNLLHYYDYYFNFKEHVWYVCCSCMQSERWCLGDGDDDEDDDDMARHMDQMYLFKTEEKKTE